MHSKPPNKAMEPEFPLAVATFDYTISLPLQKTAAPHPTGWYNYIQQPSEKSHTLGEDEILELQDQGFPRGLAETLTRNNAEFPLRVWVIDNSGSMRIDDGCRIVETDTMAKMRLVKSTRWSELIQTVEYHARLAYLLKAPTVFRLLNDPGVSVGPQQFSIGEMGAMMLDADLAQALQTMKNAQPGGVTPLTAHVLEIRDNIMAMAPSLRRDGAKVAVVLATDGLPTDSQGNCDDATKREFADALRSLESLPVWIVIRLCTDDKNVVAFYNSLDDNLELSIDCLDDYISEAKEVNKRNKWLNYALPLHRCREQAYHNRLFDILDERPLSHDELCKFLLLLFGEDSFEGTPDPQVDWNGFKKRIAQIISSESHQWNPAAKKMSPWIDIKKLDKVYGKKSCTIM